LGDELGAFDGGVDAVGLDCAGEGVDAVVDHGHEGCVVGGGFVFEDRGEGFDVVGAVVGGEGDADQEDADVGGLERGEELIEVAAGEVGGEAAEAVVAAELEDDHIGVEGEDLVDAGEGVFGGVAGDALVDDLVMVAVRGEEVFEVGGVALAFVQAVAGGDAVTKTNQQFLGWCGAQGGCDKADCKEGHQFQRGCAAGHEGSVAMMRRNGVGGDCVTRKTGLTGERRTG